MNCVEFGFDRSRGFGSARGQFWPIAVDRLTHPYNVASTTAQQMMISLPIAVSLTSMSSSRLRCKFLHGPIQAIDKYEIVHR
jgi:hypothetical protein